MYLKCTETIAEFNYVDQAVEVVGGEHEEVALLYLAPPPYTRQWSMVILLAETLHTAESGHIFAT